MISSAILALAAILQVPAPSPSPSAIVLAQETRRISTSDAIGRILGPGQGTVGCRVLPQSAPFYATRTMAPALTPPTLVHVEVCVLVDEAMGYENRVPDSIGFGFFNGMALTSSVAFDPAFAFPVVLPFTIATPNQTLIGGPFDGVIDFAGTSGQVAHITTAQLVVTDLAVIDPSFFLAPWDVFVHTDPNGVLFHLFGTGPLAGARDTYVALAVTATYQ